MRPPEELEACIDELNGRIESLEELLFEARGTLSWILDSNAANPATAEKIARILAERKAQDRQAYWRGCQDGATHVLNWLRGKLTSDGTRRQVDHLEIMVDQHIAQAREAEMFDQIAAVVQAAQDENEGEEQ